MLNERQSCTKKQLKYQVWGPEQSQSTEGEPSSWNIQCQQAHTGWPFPTSFFLPLQGHNFCRLIFKFWCKRCVRNMARLQIHIWKSLTQFEFGGHDDKAKWTTD